MLEKAMLTGNWGLTQVPHSRYNTRIEKLSKLSLHSKRLGENPMRLHLFVPNARPICMLLV